jgi:hypothetical protein
VILVGGAIALAHLFKADQTESAAILGGLGGVGLGLFFVVFGLILRRLGRLARERGWLEPNFLPWLGWYMIVVGCVGALWSAMILLGLAAGAK